MVLLILTVIFFVQIGFYYPSLPETMATHFDAAGNPDGWLSKTNFVIFEFFLMLIVVGQFALIPLLVEKMPHSLVNIPNKNYWLAEERRAETFGFIRKYFEWFAVVLLLMFIAINQLVFQANIDQKNLSGNLAWLIVAAFLLFTVVWLIGLMRKFRKTG